MEGIIVFKFGVKLSNDAAQVAQRENWPISDPSGRFNEPPLDLLL